MRPFVSGFFILVLTISSAQAQECSRVGAETCMNGAIYQCMEAQYFSSWARSETLWQTSTISTGMVLSVDFFPSSLRGRQGEDRAWRCDTAERMRSKRDQWRLRLGGKRAGHKDRLA